MIWSVSTFSAGSGITRLLKLLNGSAMFSLPSGARGDGSRIGDDAVERGCGRRQRRGEERSRALALATLEVAIARADDVLARRALVAVHGDAHAAAGFAPLGACRAEDLVEAFALRLGLHLLRPRHHHHPPLVGDVAAAQHPRRETEV